jgi:hypothetical protein
MIEVYPGSNGRRACDMVRRFLTGMGFSPMERRLADRTVFEIAFDGPADQGVAQVIEASERFVFHFVFPGYAPAKRRPALGEFIARANWPLIEGRFQLDFDSGALRYAVGIDFTNAELTEPLVRNAILSGMETIEIFAEGLRAVAAGEMDPADAFKASSGARSG